MFALLIDIYSHTSCLHGLNGDMTTVLPVLEHKSQDCLYC